jgi:hypothetical protein
MAAHPAGPEFERAMRPILQATGPLPHGSPSVGHWRQQPFQQTHKAVLPADQVRLQINFAAYANCSMPPRIDLRQLAANRADKSH